MKLVGKVAIVTGAASGFGRAIAERFLLEGARSSPPTSTARACASWPPATATRSHPVQGDVSQKVDVDAMVRAATEAFGGIDIVVNNAGVTHRNQPLLEVGEAEFDRIYAVNVKSIYLSTIAAVPKMERRGGGIIINIASTAGVRPRPGLTWYNGSKGAVITLTKSMAVELAPKNIRVNAINPVMGETGMLSSSWARPTRRRTAPSFSPAFRSAGCRARTTSPTRRCSSPTRRRPSSPASPSRSTAAAASSVPGAAVL